MKKAMIFSSVLLVLSFLTYFVYFAIYVDPYRKLSDYPSPIFTYSVSDLVLTIDKVNHPSIYLMDFNKTSKTPAKILESIDKNVNILILSDSLDHFFLKDFSNQIFFEASRCKVLNNYGDNRANTQFGFSSHIKQKLNDSIVSFSFIPYKQCGNKFYPHVSILVSGSLLKQSFDNRDLIIEHTDKSLLHPVYNFVNVGDDFTKLVNCKLLIIYTQNNLEKANIYANYIASMTIQDLESILDK